MANIRALVDPDTKAAFHSAAIKHGTSEAGLLQMLLSAFLKSNPPNSTPIAATETKNDKLSLRLSAKLKGELTYRAKGQGMTPSAYWIALARAHVSQEAFFTERELDVLRKSNNELTAIGRNINQIARALNTSLDSAHMARAKELEDVAAVVKNNRDYVRGLIRTNLASWGIKHEIEEF